MAELDFVECLDALRAKSLTHHLGAFQHMNVLNVCIEPMLGAALGVANTVANHCMLAAVLADHGYPYPDSFLFGHKSQCIVSRQTLIVKRTVGSISYWSLALVGIGQLKPNLTVYFDCCVEVLYLRPYSTRVR